MINGIKEITKKIEGWLADVEGELLYNLAKNCTGKGVIVEIGSWKGKSTIWLAKGSQAGNRVKVYAIDPHTGSSEHRRVYGNVWTFEEFKRNIKKAGVDDIVVPIVKTSQEAVKDFDRPVELIFIDGAHEYEFVKLDFELWYPKVVEGGIMAFHDSVGSGGPKKVVEEFILKSRNFKNVRFVYSTIYATKVEKNSMADIIRNRYILFLINLYDFSKKLHLPKPIKKLGKRILQLIQ